MRGQSVMNTNAGEYLKTRKFWDKIITMVLIVLTWAFPQIGIQIPVEMLVGITVFLLAVSAWVIRGDINFDLEMLQQGRQLVEEAQKNAPPVVIEAAA